MADVVLDELYAEEAAPMQQDGELAVEPAEAEETEAPLSHEQLLEQLKTQLQGLRDKFASAVKCPDYVDIAAQAKALCGKARRGAAKLSQEQQTAAILDAAAKAAAAGQDPLEAKVAAAGAAAAGQSLTDDALAALLPSPDDGMACLLLHVAPQHSSARLSAFAGRYGPEPAKVYKEEGRGFAVLVFSNTGDRDTFVSGFRVAQQTANAANSDLVLLLPGERVPYNSAAVLCGKRKREQQAAGGRKGPNDRPPREGQRQKGGGGGGGGSRQSGPRDIRSAVCPWWDRPYHEQLSAKAEAVTSSLRQLTEEVSKTYPVSIPKPEWLSAALASPHKAAVALPGIVRSPQVDGYRTKAEFSIGLDDQERPTVGFLSGNYVDGHTQVVDPSGCLHMSPTSLAYAKACTEFLRGPDNQLPAWDKRKGQGFWRLLIVREGREETFLPFPAIAPDTADAPTSAAAAAAADGSDQQQQQQQQRHRRLGKVPDPGVLVGSSLQELPVERWVVQNPLAAAAAAAAADAVGIPLSQVFEGEAPAPAPAHVLVMVQINPLAAGGPDAAGLIKQQLLALEQALKAAAGAQGLALTSLAVQYHSGVSNAAPAAAPYTPFGELPAVRAQGAKQQGEQEEKEEEAAAAAAAAAAAMGVGGGVLGITDALCELKFRVSPTAFYQVNSGGTCMLYHTVGRLAEAGPGSLLLDVCCGTGTIGLTLAKQVARVVGIDNVQSAIDDAKANAALNSITNATFVCGAAEKVMNTVLQEYAPKYSNIVAVVDPPRVGLHKDVLFALLTCPAIKRLVFVSCNPDSLVLNSKILCGRYRPDLNAPKIDPRRAKRQKQEQVAPYTPLPEYVPFRPTKAMAFDLFPHTAHVEAVVLFERD